MEARSGKLLRRKKFACLSCCNAQNADGGWGFHPQSESRVEPTCWALQALCESSAEPPPDEASRVAFSFLRAAQLADGSWPSTTRRKAGLLGDFALLLAAAGCERFIACRRGGPPVALPRLAAATPRPGDGFWLSFRLNASCTHQRCRIGDGAGRQEPAAGSSRLRSHSSRWSSARESRTPFGSEAAARARDSHAV